MSEYKDYQVIANRMDDGAVRLEQSDGLEPDADIIVLTPDQLVRLGEWAKSWAKRRGSE